jgi:membrane-bound lytic murein transglycosylase B
MEESLGINRKHLAISSISSSLPSAESRSSQFALASALALVIVLGIALPGPWRPPAYAAPFAELQKSLVRDGFEEAEILALYSRPEAALDYEGVTAYFLHREATLNYDQFLSKSSIEKAVSYLKLHEKALQEATKQYGVEAEIVTAILLVESRLGTYTGKQSVLNTLSNLAAIADPYTRDSLWNEYVSRKVPGEKDVFNKWAARKSAWAYKELKAYLQYVKAQGLDPFSVRGSYAGALGFAQFVPSSVLTYGRDGDKDGKVDLHQHDDAIDSIAYYLKQHGWEPKVDGKRAFDVLLRYNNSKYYADTILKVADRIAAR